MIWALLAVVGVPLWVCALALGAVLLRNHGMRTRPGDVVVRVRRPGSQRWTRAHAIWVSDVFLWRGSPAAWTEHAHQVTGACVGAPSADERRKLRRLGPDPLVATMTAAGSVAFDVAGEAGRRGELLGPCAGDREPLPPARQQPEEAEAARPALT